MTTAVILGAGQMGRKLAALLNRNHVELLAYGDNNPDCHDSQASVPVLSVEAALALAPDLVLIGVASSARSQALIQQAQELGYVGKVIALSQVAALFDLRAATLQALLPRLQDVPGDIAELGVYQGDFAWQLNLAFPDRPLHLFDTFSGFDETDLAVEAAAVQKQARLDFSDTSADAVMARMPYPEQVVLHAGRFPETAAALERCFALVSLDADLYTPTLAALLYFLPRMNDGGVLLVHDYANPRFPGVAQAVHDYEAQQGTLALLPLPDLHGTAAILAHGGRDVRQ